LWHFKKVPLKILFLVAVWKVPLPIFSDTLQSATKNRILVALCIVPLKILFLAALYKAPLKMLSLVALCKVPLKILFLAALCKMLAIAHT
jgi:hypothetical protein